MWREISCSFHLFTVRVQQSCLFTVCCLRNGHVRGWSLRCVLLREGALWWRLLKAQGSLTSRAACDDGRVFDGTQNIAHVTPSQVCCGTKQMAIKFHSPLFCFPERIARTFITVMKQGENVLIRNMHDEREWGSFLCTHINSWASV